MKALLLLLLALPAGAELVEIKSMKELMPKLEPGTLVVFDIDNTLLTPSGNIGSDHWYEYLIDAYKRDDAKLTEEQAEAKAAEAWSKTLPKVKPVAVEDIEPAFVAAIQKRGLKVMALTAREPADAAVTFAQLKAVGYDLSAAAPSAKDWRSKSGGLYSKGVFLGGDGNKGEFLVEFIKAAGLRPKAVVFADDKLKHAKNVDAALTAAGIPVTAFRYGGADPKISAFRAVMGEAATASDAARLFHGTGL
jgi:glycerophosphoryl diester phosphodiesterase